MDKRRNIKILFFSDTHLGFDYKVSKTSKPSRGEDFFTNFNKVLDRAKEIKVDLIIHGGDLFDKSSVNQKVIDRCYDALYQVADSGIPIIIIPGNHDPKPLPSSLFINHSNLYFQQATSSVTLSLNGKSFLIQCIPYIKNIREVVHDEFNKLKKEQIQSDFKILLLHQSLEGAKVGPIDFTFKKNRKTISRNQIPSDYNIVLSGHIHRYQIIDIDNSWPFVYCGSTERTSFSEINEEKGFVILEFTRKKSFLQPEINFETLETRKMHEIFLDVPFTTENNLIKELTNKVSNLEPTSIFRIDSNHSEVKLKLSKKVLNKCFSEKSIVGIKGISKIFKSKNK